MIKDIKENNNTSACRAYGESKNTCHELYYYLLYFQPDYLATKTTNNNKESLISNYKLNNKFS